MRLLVVENEPDMAEGVPSRAGRRVLLFLLFAIYLVLLAWIVVWKLEVPYIGGGELRQVKLVPFAPSACDGASELSEVVANVLLFVPFGLYLGLLVPTWPWWKTAGAVAGASLALEVAQYTLDVGSSDVTDLLTNTTGGLAGLGLLVLARRRLGARTVAAMTRVCSALTVLALLATAILVSSPLSFGPQPDVLVSKHAVAAPGTGAVVDEPRRLDNEARGQRCGEDESFGR
jgi:glycopeptide antibiotics resistance protein